MNRVKVIFQTNKYKQLTDRFATVETSFDINMSDSNNITSKIKNVT